MSNTLEELNEAAKRKVRQCLLQALESLDSDDVISCRVEHITHPEELCLGSRYEFLPSRSHTLKIELDFVTKEKT